MWTEDDQIHLQVIHKIWYPFVPILLVRPTQINLITYFYTAFKAIIPCNQGEIWYRCVGIILIAIQCRRFFITDTATKMKIPLTVFFKSR